MYSKKKIFFFVLIIFFVCFVLFLFICPKDNKQELFLNTASLNNHELTKIQDGDIILRYGFGMASDIIVKTFNNNIGVSHCGIIVKNFNEFYVIHSVSSSLSDFDGMQINSLNKFLKDSHKNSIIILRFKNIASRTLNNTNNNIFISDKARYYLNKKIPFDNNFNLSDSSKLYCTELVWKIIKDKYNIDIFNAKKVYNKLTFDCFLDTTYFSVILNQNPSIN